MARRTTGIRLNDTEYELIKSRADEHGLTLGKFIKTAALERKIKVRKTTDPSLLRELNYVGNNLNQVAKSLNILVNRNQEMNKENLRIVEQLINELNNKILAHKEAA